MDAESKELLREWLIRSLEPVCDADPEVLSKYVLALVQNNPKKEGLMDTCITKLEEFLGDETAPFVNRLFKAIDTGSYKSTADVPDEYPQEGDEQQQPNEGFDDQSRRRARSSDDEDERRRFSKRRRDDDRSRDSKRFSPRRERGDNGRRQPFGQRDMRGGRGGGPGGPMGGRGGGERGYGMDRRRNFPPEWGMPPPPMGMWPHPGYPPRGGFPPHPMAEFDPNVYNPENPGMMPPQMGMMMPRHMGGQFYPQHGRGGRGRGRGGHGEDGGKDDERAGASGGEGVAGARTTLRVSNVDPKYVNMTKLSLHFSKFGNVVNVQMRPQFKCAYVQYATEEEAKKAFHSPIPVCNNRFIEVKWAKYDAKDPQGAPVAEQTGGETKQEGPEATTTSDNAEGAPAGTGEATASIPEKEMTTDELRAAALEKGRKVLEEKRELLEKQKQLMKQKEELLKRQLSQQKEILERMSQNSSSVSLEDKRNLLNKITSLSEELKALQKSVAPAASLSRANSGDDNIPGLKAELNALEAQASAGSGYAGRGRGGGRWGGRGYYRGGGRGGRGRGGFAPHHSNSLDNRTTIVHVKNLPDEARDPSVLEQHFGNFGMVEKVVLDESSPSQGYIKFQDRYSGQTALSHGSQYGQTKLELSWVEPQQAPPSMSKPAATDNGNSGAADSASASVSSGEVQAAA
ncbi:TPA: hypothetical protein N0F65_000742 [Lagenidium giganteum]|uniref:RRM domain-containing protein n=1 Tax=Lagenidium giganteum TaxID=4803 RepID=A0AAV2ZKQ0_9STRA|nr:TPA: hypothetical protein N0F65_000742 [Lagenidium giganteum]